jgi:hypothetical protein
MSPTHHYCRCTTVPPNTHCFPKKNTFYVHIHINARLELQILKATKEQPAIINGALRTALVLCPLYLIPSHPLSYKYEHNSKTITEVK